MKTILLVLIFGIGLTNSSFAQENIGYFSSSKLLSLFPEAKNIQTEIEKISKEKQAIGTTLETDLKAKIDNYEKGKATMADVIKETRIDEIKRLEAKIKEYYTGARKEIEEKRQALLKPLFAKVGEAIKNVAKANKFTAIIDLDSGGQFLLYIDESKDILGIMAKELNLKME